MGKHQFGNLISVHWIHVYLSRQKSSVSKMWIPLYRWRRIKSKEKVQKDKFSLTIKSFFKFSTNISLQMSNQCYKNVNSKWKQLVKVALTGWKFVDAKLLPRTTRRSNIKFWHGWFSLWKNRDFINFVCTH